MEHYLNDLMDFIARAVTPWHAASVLAERLRNQGFVLPDPVGPLPFRGLVERDGSLIAWRLEEGLAEPPRMVAAHTDSPALRIKPRPAEAAAGLVRLGVEVYGGPILSTWFDRELGLAGRVCVETASGEVRCLNLDMERPMAVLPSLAIHLAPRDKGGGGAINRENHMRPVLALLEDGDSQDFTALLTRSLEERHPDLAPALVLDWDMQAYCFQPPVRCGQDESLLCGPRLDNLLSCHAAVRAIEGTFDGNCLIILHNHEEIGSTSAAGAEGVFLQNILSRLPRPCRNLLDQALLLSVDNAHALHPNHQDRSDPGHAPLLGRGLAIKRNASLRYATCGQAAALFKRLCREADVPAQDFVMRADMPCGSTLGPLLAARTGALTVDVGVPSLGMHSIRETVAVRDAFDLARVLEHFFTRPGPPAG